MKDFKFYLKKVQIISESKQFNDIKSIIVDLEIAIGTNDLEKIKSSIEILDNQINNNLEDEQYEEIIELLEPFSNMIISSTLTKDIKEDILNLYESLKTKILDAQHILSSSKDDPQRASMMNQLVDYVKKLNDVIYAFYLDSKKQKLGFTDSSTKEDKTFIFEKNDTKKIEKEITIKDFNFKNVFNITPKNIELKLDIESPENIKYSLQQKINNKIINEKDITGDKNTENITLKWNDTLILTLTTSDKQKIVIQYSLSKYS